MYLLLALLVCILKYGFIQKILWRDNPDELLICVQLKTVTFGMTSVTYLVTCCLVKKEKIHEEIYPV